MVNEQWKRTYVVTLAFFIFLFALRIGILEQYHSPQKAHQNMSWAEQKRCRSWAVLDIYSSHSFPKGKPDWCLLLLGRDDRGDVRRLGDNDWSWVVTLDSRWHRYFCPYSLCRLSSWDNVSERKNLGFLYAVDHGAEEVVDLAQKEGLPPVHLMEEGYIPVTYPTGLLWNPYPSMLGTPDLWPKGFPAELREVKQEVLNEEMERVPATSIGIVQSLPRPSTPSIPHPLTLPPLLALGLKTFAPLADSTTLFTKSALWALFLPNHQSSSATLRGLFAQPLLWRVGLYTAFSLATLSDQQLEEGPDSEDDFDDIDVRLLQALRQTNFSTTCTTVAGCLKLIYSQHHKTGQSHLEAWLFDLKQIGYQTPQLRPHKQFAYLTQGAKLTSTSNPRLNVVSNISSSSFDTFYLSFSGNGSGDLFFPKSTFQQGRNALLRLALAMEVTPGYEYFVFTDEDVVLQNIDDPLHAWKTNMSTDPWVRMEEFLLEFQPTIGFNRYTNWVQTANNSGIFSITNTHDICVAAYSRYTLEFELPIVESFLDKLSSWNQAGITFFLEKVFYSQSAYQINSIKTVNTGREYHNADYKQGWNWDQMTEFMLRNLNTDVAENPLIQMFYKMVGIFKKGGSAEFGSMKLDYGKFNLSKKALQPLGIYFEPELLKFFNMCGSILQTQCRWWHSGLLYGKLSQSTLDTKIECALAQLNNSCV